MWKNIDGAGSTSPTVVLICHQWIAKGRWAKHNCQWYTHSVSHPRPGSCRSCALADFPSPTHTLHASPVELQTTGSSLGHPHRLIVLYCLVGSIPSWPAQSVFWGVGLNPQHDVLLHFVPSWLWKYCLTRLVCLKIPQSPMDSNLISKSGHILHPFFRRIQVPSQSRKKQKSSSQFTTSRADAPDLAAWRSCEGSTDPRKWIHFGPCEKRITHVGSNVPEKIREFRRLVLMIPESFYVETGFPGCPSPGTLKPGWISWPPRKWSWWLWIFTPPIPP